MSLPAPPGVTLLKEPAARNATAWLRDAVTAFGTAVAAFVPGHFPAYVRVYHPFGVAGATTFGPSTQPRWADLMGGTVTSAREAAEFALNGLPHAQAPVGCAPRLVLDRLLPPLIAATTTPEACFFGLWDGFGDSVVPATVRPTLHLPHRSYHVFAGPVSAATASYSWVSFGFQSANLWWPADRAWCVATEVDAAWTYVAGARSCIDAILAAPELDAVETAADAPW